MLEIINSTCERVSTQQCKPGSSKSTPKVLQIRGNTHKWDTKNIRKCCLCIYKMFLNNSSLTFQAITNYLHLGISLIDLTLNSSYQYTYILLHILQLLYNYSIWIFALVSTIIRNNTFYSSVYLLHSESLNGRYKTTSRKSQRFKQTWKVKPIWKRKRNANVNTHTVHYKHPSV